MTAVRRRSQTVIRLVLVAVFGALSFVCTAFCPIPISGGQGYLNFSDLFIFITSALIGPAVGGLVGALSGAMSDLYAGFAQFALWTALIKLVEGVLAGYLFRALYKTNASGVRKALAFTSFYLGGLVMAGGYVVAEIFLYTGSVALFDLPFNLLQGAVNATLAIPCFLALARAVGYEQKNSLNTRE